MVMRRRRDRLSALPLSLAALRGNLRIRRDRLNDQGGRLPTALMRLGSRWGERLTELAGRLIRARGRTLTDAARNIARDRDRTALLARRLNAVAARLLPPRRESLDRLDRLRQTLGYKETLKRGYAVVHGPDGLITRAADAARTPVFEVEFLDGRIPARPETPPAKPTRKPKPEKDQKSLF